MKKLRIKRRVLDSEELLDRIRSVDLKEVQRSILEVELLIAQLNLERFENNLHLD
jgi:hypothetical protein